jgi:hypothetical protein
MIDYNNKVKALTKELEALVTEFCYRSAMRFMAN